MERAGESELDGCDVEVGGGEDDAWSCEAEDYGEDGGVDEDVWGEY